MTTYTEACPARPRNDPTAEDWPPTNSKQVVLRGGPKLHLEAPGGVAKAIREVVDAVRHDGPLPRLAAGSAA
jgi:hypothetical protein